MHVLIADDDPTYRSLLEEFLTEWGFQVTTAADGEQAWQAVQSDPTIRLAILDWVMPLMDGCEVCRRLKEDPAARRVHVVLITGSRLKDEIIKVLVAGADDYVMKPFEAIDLKIRVLNAVRIVQLEDDVAALTGAKGVPARPAVALPHPAGRAV